MSIELKKKNIKHNSIFTIFLCLLPILALNIGYRIIGSIDEKFHNEKRKEAAILELQSMANSDNFEFQFAKYANLFGDFLKTAARNLHNNDYFSDYIALESKKIFAPPFPEYNLFVFHISEENKKCEQIYKKIIGKSPGVRETCSVFEYLVSLNRKEKTKKFGESATRNFFKSTIDVSVYGKDQKGKASLCLYNFISHRFIWNYYEIKGKGIYGFYLLCKNDSENENNAKALFFKEKNNERASYSYSNYLKNAIRIYIPLFENFGLPVYQKEAIKNYKPYLDWEKSLNLPIKTEDIPKKELEFFKTEDIKKEFIVYSFLGKMKSHLSVLFLPVKKNSKISDWLWCTNLLYLTVIFLILIRGFIFGLWPKINLKYRFTINFLLAAVLPISMLYILAYAYIKDFEESSKLEYLSELQSCLNEFESRKDYLWEKYKNIVSETQKNQTLINQIEKNGTVECKEVKETITSIFNDKFDVPLEKVYLIDKDLNGTILVPDRSASNKENSYKPVLKIVKDREIISNDIYAVPLARILVPVDDIINNPNLTLKNKKEKIKQRKKSYHKEHLTEIGFDALGDKQLYEQIEGEEGQILVLNLNNTNKNMCVYRLLRIKNNKYALGINWKDDDLDLPAYNQTQSILSINKQNFSFIAFQQTSDGFVPFSDTNQFKITNSSLKNAAFLEEARKIAQTAFLQKISLTKNIDNFYISAMPTQKFKDIVIVGACDMSNINQVVFSKQIVILFVFLISALIVLFCVYITSKIVLIPITGLKQALDKISSGNLNIIIKNNGKDELGNLCNAFQSMINGLRDRKKLATLISDQAIDALSSGSLKTESFKGVALVSDIRNFTGTCETYDPTLITDLLNKHFAEMSSIISQQGGRIYKFIGDAIEAVFPENNEYTTNASNRAFMAASEMIKKLSEINKRRISEGLFSYKIGVGLKYGEMYSGTVGSVETRLDYTILGEPLKIAAKLEALSIQNPYCPIVIDEYIRNELDDKELEFINIESKNINLFSPKNILIDEQITVKSSSGLINQKNERELYNKNIFEKIYTYSEFNRFSRMKLFISIFLFVAMIFVLFCAGFNYIANTQIKYFTEQKSEYNKRLIEQIKFNDSAPLIAFENISRNIIQDIGNKCGYKIENINKIEEYLKILEKEYNFEIIFKSYNKAEDEPIRKAQKHSVPKMKLVYNDKVIRIKKSIKYYDEYVISITSDYSFFFKNIEKQYVRAFSDKPHNIYVAIKEQNKFDSEWVYSEGFDVNILASDKKSNEKYVINTEKDTNGDIKIDNKTYNFIIANKIPELYKINFRKVLVLCFVLFLLFFIVWLQTYRERTIINSSLKVKLWLSLICVAIIPVLSLLILYNLYSAETEKRQIQDVKADLQQFTQNFESKESFSVPAGMKKVSLISNSPELKKEIKNYINRQNTSSKANSKKRVVDFLLGKKEIMEEYKNLSFGKYLTKIYNGKYQIFSEMHMEITEISVNGKDWSISARDYFKGKKDSSNSNKTKFNDIFVEIGKEFSKLSSENNVSNDNNVSSIAKSAKISEGLKLLTNLFGADIYIKLSSSINTPIIFSAGDTTIAIFIQVVPEIKKSDFIIIWVIAFNKRIRDIAQIYNNRNDLYYKDLFFSDYLKESLSVLFKYMPKLTYKVYAGNVSNHGKVEYDEYLPFDFNNHIFKYSSYISNSRIPINEIFEFNGSKYFCHGKICENIPDRFIMSICDLEGIYRLNDFYIISFCISLSIAIILIILIAHNVAKDILEPIAQLVKGIKEVDKEHYKYRIEIERDDELGVLCQSFNSMIRGLEEKQLMGKMVSKIAQTVSLSNNEETSRKSDCVLLYITVKDFSEKMKSISPDNLINELKFEVEHIANSVINEGGEIDKIMGEKQLIAFYTFNKTLKESVISACQAAKSIIEKQQKGILPFHVALGISYGEVITGFLGVGEKRDFTVIGDPVNVSARIASYAEKQEEKCCLLSNDVYEIAKEKFEGEFIGELSLKGKSLPMKVYGLNF